MDKNDAVYQQTRKLVLSPGDPFFFKGKFAEGTGSPHAGMDMVWPLGIITRALTSKEDREIQDAVRMLIATHAGTGFIHESFHKDDPSKFTRKWFAWANTLFGEFLWETFKNKPHLLV